jgi:hypothetical protein
MSRLFCPNRLEQKGDIRRMASRFLIGLLALHTTFYCYKIRALNPFVLLPKTKLGRNYQSLRT